MGSVAAVLQGVGVAEGAQQRRGLARDLRVIRLRRTYAGSVAARRMGHYTQLRKKWNKYTVVCRSGE